MLKKKKLKVTGLFNHTWDLSLLHIMCVSLVFSCGVTAPCAVYVQNHLRNIRISVVDVLYHFVCRKLFQPQQNLLTVPEAQVSPLRDTPNSSPAHRSKHSLPEEYIDPLANKKPRISHLSRKTASNKSRPRPSDQVAHKDVTKSRADDGRRNSLDPRKLLDSLSAVCQQQEEVAKRLEPTPCAQEEPGSPEGHPQPDSVRPPSPLIVPDRSKHTTKRKKSKHKHKDQVSVTSLEVCGSSTVVKWPCN